MPEPQTFPYIREEVAGENRWYPRIPVTIHELARTETVSALVDSGAEHNIFGLEVARRLDISLKDARPVTVFGVGDAELAGKLTVVELELAPHHFAAPAIFVEGLSTPAILGQAGFFQFFDVTFRRKQRRIELTTA